MHNFIQTANLPRSKVALAAVGDYPDVTSALAKLGIQVISLRNDILPREVCRHADMLLCHTGKGSLFCARGTHTSELEKLGFITSLCAALGEKYPQDVPLNVAVGSDFFVYNPKTADSALTDCLLASGKRGIPVKQGYSKCSVCFVTENAVITEDEGIKNALESIDTQVLLISKGDIYLSDTHYGFFGGCTGKLDKDVLAVTGELKYHKDGEKIKTFCEKQGVSVLELTKGRITDVGGILPLAETKA